MGALEPDFGGSTYKPEHDGPRLRHQLDKVRSFMLGHGWATLAQIADELKIPEASASARLRDLRKIPNGAYTIDRRRVPGGRGLHEYKVKVGAP